MNRGVPINIVSMFVHFVLSIWTLDVGPVSIINTTNNTAYASTNVGNYPWGVAVTPDGTKAYVANSVDNTISVIDTTNNTFYSSVNVENVPAAFWQFIGNYSIDNPPIGKTTPKLAWTQNPFAA